MNDLARSCIGGFSLVCFSKINCKINNSKYNEMFKPLSI